MFDLTENCPEVKVSACATDADEGKKLILQYDPDLVFLDINMPGQNGFDLLSSLPRYDFEIIFVWFYPLSPVSSGKQKLYYTEANTLMKQIHNSKERMPTILPGHLAEDGQEPPRNIEQDHLQEIGEAIEEWEM